MAVQLIFLYVQEIRKFDHNSARIPVPGGYIMEYVIG